RRCRLVPTTVYGTARTIRGNTDRRTGVSHLMQRFRFDQAVAHQITVGGSKAALTPLMWRKHPQVHVGIIYIPPGGGCYRHPEPEHQLFCVISGRGWVTGGDGAREVIAEGEAV